MAGSRSSLVTATAVAAVLLAPLTATTPVATAITATAAPRTTVVRLVEYGDKAVVVPKGRKGVVRFRGHRGDLVTLDGVRPARTRLLRSGTRLRSPWDDSALFRLPRTGTYAFHVGVQRHQVQVVTLVKARVHRLPVDGAAVRTPKERRGYIDLGAVRIGAGERVTVDTGRTEQLVYQARGSSCSAFGGPLLLRTGHDVQVADDLGGIGCDEVRRGTSLVRLRSGHRATAASAVEVAVDPDGAPVTLSAPRKAAREVVLTFPATVDDYVYVEHQAGVPLVNRLSRLDRWGRTATPLLTDLDPSGAGFVAPTTGPSELSTVTSAIGGSTTTTVRVRTGVRAADLVPDGAAVDLTLDGSGTRVYSLATGNGVRLDATTRDLDPAESWRVEAGPLHPYFCGPDPSGPLGCSDNGFVALSGTELSATSVFTLVGPVALATPAAGTAGTVSIRLLTTR
ncbi:hypothetical protein KDN32_05070 [Nocardioides sp. J2M5]|uniref:hypothetical protein n=1 Tax=Nocardioides palaemonis TaxID=2829810 RepID=UPI001BA6EAAD|nr:hypothetical protein [Nocardioides palaemonis]MBS2937111.1 hypothetical protein [Nocardioides palaemonis]